MWGEIEPRNKSVTVSTPHEESQDELEIEQNSRESSDTNNLDEGSKNLASMIDAIVASGSPVKSQQLGEPDLTADEKKRALIEQYKTKPLVFLERYHAHLQPEHLEAFGHVSSDCRTRHYCTEVQKRASQLTNRTRVRNHRYAALRALQEEGQYFSEEQMRIREPLLYEQYIGQYLNDEEILQRSENAMRNAPTGLADLLINSYQEKVLQNRLQEEQDREDCAEEEDEEENDEPKQAEWEPSAEEKAMLREEFLSQMHQSFIDGKDKDFNYSEVDENPNYDNLDIVSHDAEERYFDNDDDDDDEIEEEESNMV